MTKVFFTGSVYPAYVDAWTGSSGRTAVSFDELLAQLRGDAHGWGAAWKQYLEATGRHTVFVTYHNWMALQQAWARARGIVVRRRLWLREILALQLEEFEPDVLIINGWEISPTMLRELRSRCASIRKVVRYDGIAANDPSFFAGADLVLSPVRESIGFYEAHGLEARLIKRGFDPFVLNLIRARPPTIPASFIGSISPGGAGHNKRLRLLDHLLRHEPIELFLSLPAICKLPKILVAEMIRQPSRLLRMGWADAQAYRRLASRSRLPVFGKAMFQTLADSRVSLNCHIDSSGRDGGNMRMFEATGMGSCLLTDWKEGLSRYFEPDREVVAYRSAAECVEKLRFLREHPDLADQIARAGQARTLRDHNEEREIAQLAADTF